MYKVINSMLQPLKKKIMHMINRAILISVTSDKENIQVLRIKSGFGIHNDVQRLQNYGMTSKPAKGSELIYLALGGNLNDMICLSVDNGPSRPKDLEDGEVVIYNEHGIQIRLEKGKLKISGGNIEFNGNSKSFVTYAELDSAIKELTLKLNSHIHQTPVGSASIPSGTSFTATLTPIIYDLDISSSKTQTVFTGG